MCCFMIIAVVVTVTFFLTVPEQRQQVTQPLPQQSKEVEDYDYLLKEEEGKLAVFATGEQRPRKVFEVYVNTLPSYDQQLLKQGLPVKNYEELLKRLEDYSS